MTQLDTVREADVRMEQHSVGNEPPARNWTRTHIIAGALLAFALLSIFVLGRVAADPALFASIRESLDAQQATVAGLAAGATALSAALSLVPGGGLEPLADQLADVSGWFVVIIAAILLQKILIAIVGPAAFGLIVPLACAVGIAAVYLRRPRLQVLAIRFAALAMVLTLAVPGSVAISDWLTTSYTDAAAAEAEADAAADEAAAAVEDAAPGPGQPADDGDDSLLDSIGDWFSGAAASVGDAVTGAMEAINEIKDGAVTALNGYMEQFALLIITTCVMPLLVIAFLGWVTKLLFSVDIGLASRTHGIGVGTSRSVRRMNRTIARAAKRRPHDHGD